MKSIIFSWSRKVCNQNGTNKTKNTLHLAHTLRIIALNNNKNIYRNYLEKCWRNVIWRYTFAQNSDSDNMRKKNAIFMLAMHIISEHILRDYLCYQLETFRVETTIANKQMFWRVLASSCKWSLYKCFLYCSGTDDKSWFSHA